RGTGALDVDCRDLQFPGAPVDDAGPHRRDSRARFADQLYQGVGRVAADGRGLLRVEPPDPRIARPGPLGEARRPGTVDSAGACGVLCRGASARRGGARDGSTASTIDSCRFTEPLHAVAARIDSWPERHLANAHNA